MTNKTHTTEAAETPDAETEVETPQAPAKAAKHFEKRWGVAKDPGFVYLPSVLLRGQARLKINAIELAVLIHLIDHWWSSSEMPYPSKRRLAERLDVSDKTVQRAIAKLEAEKLVRRVARHYSAGGQASNYYDLSPLVDRLKDLAGDFIEAREEARKAKRKAERPGLRNRKKAAEVQS